MKKMNEQMQRHGDVGIEDGMIVLYPEIGRRLL